MPSRMSEKIKFLNDEITGLRSRIGGAGNAVQHAKLDLLEDIRNDYEQSVARQAQREKEEA